MTDTQVSKTSFRHYVMLYRVKNALNRQMHTDVDIAFMNRTQQDDKRIQEHTQVSTIHLELKQLVAQAIYVVYYFLWSQIHVSLLSCPRNMQLYHTESLHPPGHPVTADALRAKQRPLSCTCQRHEGTQGGTITSAQERGE
jgi:hypothetical protein